MVRSGFFETRYLGCACVVGFFRRRGLRLGVWVEFYKEHPKLCDGGLHDERYRRADEFLDRQRIRLYVRMCISKEEDL